MHTVGILNSTKFSTRKEKDGDVNIATIEIEVALENLQHDDLRFLAVKQGQAVDMSLLPNWGNRKPGDLVGRTLPLTDSEQERYDAEAETAPDQFTEQPESETLAVVGKLIKHNMGQTVYRVHSVTNGMVLLADSVTGHVLGPKISMTNIDLWYEQVEE